MSSRTLSGLVLLLALAAAGPPIDAQPASRIPKIGFLSSTTQGTIAPYIAAFRQGLRELGYVEGKTVVIELRLAGGAVEQFPKFARELVALKPDVIVATNDLAIASVRRETQTISIVMAFSSDPAGAGFVTSLARPGGNVTAQHTFSRAQREEAGAAEGGRPRSCLLNDSDRACAGADRASRKSHHRGETG